MSTSSAIEYTQLDTQTQLRLVRNRLKALEISYMNLKLRLEAPDVNEITTEQDRENLNTLEEGVRTLQELEQKLVNATGNGRE